MPLRKSNIIKIIALLLFAFELLAPPYLSSRIEGTENESSAIQLHMPTSFSVFSSLFDEEAGSEEERGGKEGQKVFQLVAYFNFVSAFSSPIHIEAAQAVISDKQVLPIPISRNTLYGVFRI